MNAARASFIGQSVERREDYRFLTGAGQYTDDIVLPQQSYGYFLRSPHAHAAIRSIDTSAARGAPGVLAVFTSRDLAGVGGGRDRAAAGRGSLPLVRRRLTRPSNRPPSDRLATAGRRSAA